MTKTLSYNRDSVLSSFRWLGHSGFGLTELNAFHPRYRPGRENFEFNKRYGYLPDIWYVKTEKQIFGFLRRYHGTHTCCIGINPRPWMFRNQSGYIRSATDKDIKTVVNFYFDFDLVDPEFRNKGLSRLEELINEIDFYLQKEKILKPVRAFTGNGYHLLFPLPPTSIEVYPDIGSRLKKFHDTIAYEFGDSMKSEGIKLDSTMDLRRVQKIPGTKKPYPQAILSRFYGNERVEDYVLKEYLLSLDLNEPAGEPALITIPTDLPLEFKALLEKDPVIQKLWNNEGKTETSDTSRSGYDYSITKAAMKKGITNIDTLSAILALRPEGACQKSGKGEHYIRRTIANAIIK